MAWMKAVLRFDDTLLSPSDLLKVLEGNGGRVQLVTLQHDTNQSQAPAIPQAPARSGVAPTPPPPPAIHHHNGHQRALPPPEPRYAGNWSSPGRKHYVGGRRDKGVSGENLLRYFAFWAEKPLTHDWLKNAFVQLGFASASASPNVTQAVRDGWIVQDANGHFNLAQAERTRISGDPAIQSMLTRGVERARAQVAALRENH